MSGRIDLWHAPKCSVHSLNLIENAVFLGTAYASHRAHNPSFSARLRYKIDGHESRTIATSYSKFESNLQLNRRQSDFVGVVLRAASSRWWGSGGLELRTLYLDIILTSYNIDFLLHSATHVQLWDTIVPDGQLEIFNFWCPV
jgi:hypothetical protein